MGGISLNCVGKAAQTFLNYRCKLASRSLGTTYKPNLFFLPPG
jgi:hypothetical protein